MSLWINELFLSIQGESFYLGMPCVFVRLAGCNLRCRWCDTKYAYYDGFSLSISEIIEKVKSLKNKLVEITGGEPLLQKEVFDLIEELIQDGYEVLLETNGTQDISRVNKIATIIMDIKCPSSLENNKTLWKNLEYLKKQDEIKFVIADRKDYEWAKNVLTQYNLLNICSILFSPVHKELEAKVLANWILQDNLPVRLNVQLHKYLHLK